jgi:YhcH/YjgK/YiaL family protein
MIKDRIENAAAYEPLGPAIAEALSYLRTTDFAKLDLGKHEIDDQRIFAIVQEYQPKKLSEAKWEAHHRYIDVQFVARGTERMGHLSLLDGPKVSTPYDPHKDVVFYEPRGDLMVFNQGDFAIFTPQDVHAPGLAIDGPSGGTVLKVVVKVRVDEKHPCGF